MAVLVTGFGPFGEVKNNPSWLVAQSLAGSSVGAGMRIVPALLPVDYGMVKAKANNLTEGDN